MSRDERDYDLKRYSKLDSSYMKTIDLMDYEFICDCDDLANPDNKFLVGGAIDKNRLGNELSRYVKGYESKYRQTYSKLILHEFRFRKDARGEGSCYVENILANLINNYLSSMNRIRIYKKKLNNEVLLVMEDNEDVIFSKVLIVSEKKVNDLNLNVNNIRFSMLKKGKKMVDNFPTLKYFNK